MNEYGCMPLPYPDELLYGVISRYHLRMNNTSPKWTLREVFGTENVIPTLDLPSHLDDLSRRSQVIRISSGQWMDEHTLYSYYAPFLPAERRKRLRRMMKSNDGSGIHVLVGITASSVERNDQLRFCPICYEEDILAYGEPYWHRTHQAAAVLICPKHRVFLHRITHPVSDRHGLTVLPIARQLFQSEPVILNLSEKAQLRLYEIAQDAHVLIRLGHSLDLYNLRDSLLHKLSGRGWLTPSNRIRQRELEEQFITYYGKELLESLSCMAYGDEYSWLAVATRKARRAIHPLRQLLLIRFLFGSFECFLKQREISHSPFGNGPWPCLNQAADHYKEAYIKNVKITRCSHTGKPVGTFICSCGFTYSRRGPDEKPEDRFRIGRIKAIGDVWKNQLAYYMEKGLSYRSAAAKLGVDTNTVIKYARGSLSNEKLSHAVCLKPSRPLKMVVPRKKHSTHYIRVDWVKRDLELSWKVEEASRILLGDKQSKPIRITSASIGKRIGNLALLEKHKDKLPITAALLSRYLESVAEFQIRRIHWAAEQMQLEFPLKRWKLIKKAGLRPDYSSAVSEILDFYSNNESHTNCIVNGVKTSW
jgi:hypothetical protein